VSGDARRPQAGVGPSAGTNPVQVALRWFDPGSGLGAAGGLRSSLVGMTQIGDRIVIRGRHVDDAARTGTVTAVSSSGGPPYRVRFDDGHEAVIYPGPDAQIVPGEGPS
jgi:hypothetical protein